MSVRIHPGFNSETLVNDLALLELAHPVAGVAQLDDGSDETPGGTATALGWGSTTASPAGDYPDALRQTLIDVEPDSACAQVYGYGYDPSRMLCAGMPKGGRDTCQGDSGGPLVAATRAARSSSASRASAAPAARPAPPAPTSAPVSRPAGSPGAERRPPAAR